MPVLDPAQDYTSLDAINKQLTQLVSTFQKFSPYLVWIVQPVRGLQNVRTKKNL